MDQKKTNMYKNTATWNPFKGCHFDCNYCKVSFQLQAKRQKNRCMDCYNFTPHYHPKRLDKIPSKSNIFVCGNGDISFCDESFMYQIIDSIKKHNDNKRIKYPKQFYFQSKRPQYFQKFLKKFPENVILITTLETNRNRGYANTITKKAPTPLKRFKQFLDLDYPRKSVTIEPILPFSHSIFLDMIFKINPEFISMGINSRPKLINLPSPSKDEFYKFYDDLIDYGFTVNLMNAPE